MRPETDPPRCLHGTRPRRLSSRAGTFNPPPPPPPPPERDGIPEKVLARWGEFFWECEEDVLPPGWGKLRIGQRKRLVDALTPVKQPRSALGKADLTGMRIWESSRVLARYLQSLHAKGALQGRSACELGAGTGLTGLVAAAMGMDVVLTDPGKPLNYAADLAGTTLDLLERNVVLNRDVLGGRAEVRRLLWADAGDHAAVLTSQGRAFDLLLGADLMYASDNSALLETLRALSGPHTQVLLCFSARHEGEARFVALARGTYGFSVRDVSMESMSNCTSDTTAQPSIYKLLSLCSKDLAPEDPVFHLFAPAPAQA